MHGQKSGSFSQTARQICDAVGRVFRASTHTYRTPYPTLKEHVKNFWGAQETRRKGCERTRHKRVKGNINPGQGSIKLHGLRRSPSVFEQSYLVEYSRLLASTRSNSVGKVICKGYIHLHLSCILFECHTNWCWCKSRGYVSWPSSFPVVENEKCASFILPVRSCSSFRRRPSPPSCFLCQSGSAKPPAAVEDGINGGWGFSIALPLSSDFLMIRSPTHMAKGCLM